MAIIKTSAIVSDIKGTSGGNVFASNKGGNYTRRYKKPTNLNSPKQQAVRDNFGFMAGLWRGLTDSQRATWNEGATGFPVQNKLGETKLLSGQQLFNRLNNTLIQANQTPLDVCPLSVSFPSITIDGVLNSISPPELLLSLAFDGSTAVPAGFVVALSATAKLSAGVSSPQKGLFKRVAIVAAGVDMAEYDMTAGYNDLFGSLTVGDTIFIGAMLISKASGESSIVSTVKSQTTV